MNKDDLISERNLLAIHRDRLAQIKVKKDALLRTVQESEEYLRLVEVEQQVKEAMELDEKTIRWVAVELFKADPDKVKQIVEGVSIREETVYDYDANKAFEYAKKHQLFLKLDPKAFEKFAKDNAEGNTELEFVTIKKEPSATIASDLSKFCLVSEEKIK